RCKSKKADRVQARLELVGRQNPLANSRAGAGGGTLMGEAKRRRQQQRAEGKLTKKLNLDDILTEAERHARREYRLKPHGDRVAELSIKAYRRDGTIMSMEAASHPAHRTEVIAHLRRLLREKGAFAYAILLEGWESVKAMAAGWSSSSGDQAMRPRDQD